MMAKSKSHTQGTSMSHHTSSKKLPKVKWLSRTVLWGPYLALTLSEDELNSVFSQLGAEQDAHKYSTPCCVTLTKPRGMTSKLACVIYLPNVIDFHLSELMGIIVHECEHVKQELFDMMGEKHPGKETEAYAIQCISQTIFSELLRRVKFDNKNYAVKINKIK